VAGVAIAAAAATAGGAAVLHLHPLLAALALANRPGASAENLAAMQAFGETSKWVGIDTPPLTDPRMLDPAEQTLS